MFQWWRRMRSPMRVVMEFEGRVYRLGGAIELTVHLSPARDVHILRGRVDLVLEERYAETFTRMEAPRAAAGLISTKARPISTIMVPKREVREHIDTSVHSSTMFLEDSHLDRDKTHTFEATLNIQPVPPTHGRGGTLTWTLVTTIETPGGRDIAESLEVAVTLP